MKLGDALVQMAAGQELDRPLYKRKFSLKTALIVLALVAVGLITFGIVRVILNVDTGAIPQSIQTQLNFTPFVVNKQSTLKVSSSSYKFDQELDGLSFIANSQSTGRLTISEQATPQEFIDVPDVYSKLVDGMNRYSVFQNQLGTVYLTRPGDQAAGQTAVTNADGVLLFIRSTRDLSDDQWRRIVDDLELQ